MFSRFHYSFIALSFCTVLATTGCKDNEGTTDKETPDTTEQPAPPQVQAPAFSGDSAYVYVAAQVAFGPRVPGTPAQKACAGWMEQKLATFCDTVYRQEATVKGGDGKSLPCINIIGAINPAASRRILLLAHWDSRPWADMDTRDQDKAILAADDGGSGVAVLIELARAIQSKPLPADLGIDILFTDVEDYGKTEWGEDSYALGTQYWARNPHIPGYKAEFGILLDMVGAQGARFPKEGISARYAGNIQQQVWDAAAAAGHSQYFLSVPAPDITDDHVYVNELARIPTIDIINLNSSMGSSFAAHWHTHQDNMSVIDKNTMTAVGETLLHLIYSMAQPS